MKILFISNNASRTGAPAVLLRFIRWLRANREDVGASMLLAEGGPLAADFATLGDLELLPRQLEQLSPIRRGVVRTMLRRADDARIRRQLGALEPPDIIYSNTVMNGRVLGNLRTSAPVVSHVHESEPWIRQHVSAEDWRMTAAATTAYVAVSNDVRGGLTRRGVPAAAVSVIPPFIDVPPDAHPTSPVERQRARNALGLPEDAFVVGGVGFLGWWKGPDLFVQVANLLERRSLGRPLHCVWIGGGTRLERDRLTHDCQMAGVEDVVHFVGEQPSTARWFEAFDVLALTSRTDSYPLVMLENGLAGNPFVCFSSSGGGPEFAGDDAGVVVPYLDVAAFADALESLLTAPDRRRELGEAAFAKARRHDVAEVAPRIYDLLLDLAGSVTT